MKLYIALNRDEIQEQIPYAIVAETMSGARWGTGKRKRLMKECFSKAEIEATYRLHRIARDWYLYKGVPDEATMTISTYDLWQKLANFCCAI